MYAEKMTVDQAIHNDALLLTVKEASDLTGISQATLRMSARHEPDVLRFPSLCIGSRVWFPRIPMLKFLGVIENQNEDTPPDQ